MKTNKYIKDGNTSNNSNIRKRIIPFIPKNEDHQLAHDIARSFEDEKSIPTFVTLIAKYGKPIIKRAFDETYEVPDRKIKKSRTALFIYLVKKYGNKKNNNSKS